MHEPLKYRTYLGKNRTFLAPKSGPNREKQSILGPAHISKFWKNLEKFIYQTCTT